MMDETFILFLYDIPSECQEFVLELDKFSAIRKIIEAEIDYVGRG